MPPRQITDQETVQGQVKGLISQGSPLMKQAETRALEKQNAMGMGNSTRAIQAGQAALYDAAMPIAQQDAQTYATSGQSAQDYGQQKGLLSTEYGLKESMMSKEYGLKGDLMKSEYGQKGILSAQEAGQQKELQKLVGSQAIGQIQEKGSQSKMLQDSAAQDTLTQQASKYGFETQLQGLKGDQTLEQIGTQSYYNQEEMGKQAYYDIQQQKLTGDQQLDQIEAQGEVQKALAKINGDISKAIQQMKNGAQISAAGISAGAQKYAAQLGAKIDTLQISSNEKQNAMNLIGANTQQFQQTLSVIQADTQMDGPAKATAVQNAWGPYVAVANGTAELYDIDLNLPGTFTDL